MPPCCIHVTGATAGTGDPVVEHAVEQGRKWHATGGQLSSNAFFLADNDAGSIEVDVVNLGSDEFASSRAGVCGEQEHRVGKKPATQVQRKGKPVPTLSQFDTWQRKRD